MSEYKVTIQATIPELFHTRTMTGTEVYEANSAKEAMDKAKREIDLKTWGLTSDMEERGATIEITDIQKL